MLVSINQLSEWTGMDRRTITQRLADLHYVDGEKGAYLYQSDEALPLIYNAKNPRDALDQKRCEEIQVRIETARKTRIPLALVTEVWDAALQAFAATLKTARDKPLTVERINDLLEKLRTAKLPLKW